LKPEAIKTRAGLINEMNIMRLLNHPNIIRLYEVYEGEHHIYFVMEYLKGGELFERVTKKGHYLEKDAALLFSKFLSGLAFMHENKVMHRDIKPENIILKDPYSFEVKLADFGLADYEMKKERLFTRCGTPGYVAPEILNDQDYDC
jgi:calcium/calmodulin-dependent protein kinase I